MRIRELRTKSGMSQADLARAIGVSTSAIGMYEQGRREPDTSAILKFARFFNVSVDYLLGASDVSAPFDVERIAANVAKNLMDQPALMFNAEIYTERELTELQAIIENSVRKALLEKLSNAD